MSSNSKVSWSKICILISSSGLGIRNLLLLTELFRGSGYDVKTRRRRLRGDWLWNLSVTTCGEGGVLMQLMGLLSWGVEKH